MIALVTGGSASGKSALAEDMAVALGSSRCYFASMPNAGAEAGARIERHRAQRAGKGFATVESSGRLEAAVDEARDPAATVLVEDLGNLVADAFFSKDAFMDSEAAFARVMETLEALADGCRHLVVVGNEIGSDGIDYDGETRAYIRLLGRVSCAFAGRCDTVVEVVAGLPCPVKGACP